MPQRTVHVIGAGLAGLAAAIALARAGERVLIYEAASQAGGRCRSYFDQGLGAKIDNGNHLLLSGNRAALAFLDDIGAKGSLVGPSQAAFDFADLASGERWKVTVNDGMIPWWIFDPRSRVPSTRAADYLALLRLLGAGRKARIGDVIRTQGELYRRLLEPLFTAALNTEPARASAFLAGAVIRETVMRGGQACRPLVAAGGLSSAFIEPALRKLAELGAIVSFGRRLRGMTFAEGSVTSLDFGDQQVQLTPHDRIVLAVPAPVATALAPGLSAPTEFRAIVNAHFAVAPPRGQPRIIGATGGTVEWLFAFDERLSTTTSNADRLTDMPREELAARIWQDVLKLTGLDAAMPPWQIVRERRATFAALPEQDAKRPPAATPWQNLVIAGDWTATGLPATIEGAIRSGNRAAKLVVETDSRHTTQARS